MKNMQNEYNNIYYWSNDFMERKPERALAAELEKPIFSSLGECEEWLENNLWKFYD